LQKRRKTAVRRCGEFIRCAGREGKETFFLGDF
jgi:hypothetical protein